MNDRRDKILEYIITNGFMSITDLAQLFPEVSSMTIRRDLEFLEEQGDVVRTKGGAKSIMHLSLQKEEAYHSREIINSDLKKEIAHKAINLIENNQCIYFDSGSTVMHIVKSLPQSSHFFAVTNGPNVAIELTKNPDCEISITGGKLNRENISLSGLGATRFLEGINIGTAIVAASGYSPDYGFTCGSFDENEIKKHVVNSAQRTVIVMDSTKVGKNHPFTFAKPSDIDIFVTDREFDKQLLDDIKKQGVKII